jgi:NADH:ubiquinone oxidoreductase subunit 4 (subunit M)
MLRAVRSVLHGELAPKFAELPDAGAWRKVPFILLLGALLLFGVFPGLLADKIKPSAERIVKLATVPMAPEKPSAPKLKTASATRP